MFIDTHCHLTDNYVSGDLNDVISRAVAAGIGMMICPTADPDDIPGAIKIAETHSNIFTTIGIHPEYAGVDASKYLTNTVLTNPRVVGVGEIGLDYHERNDNRAAQIKLFEQQLELAKKHARGVMHCFTSSWDLAKKMLDRGFYFSASGILTFKNAVEIRETFAKIPIDRIVIETDSPYCAPVPYRGKTCEPAFVIETARVLADIHGLQLADLETILYQNTMKLYPKCHVK